MGIIRVLVVDDNEEQRKKIKQILFANEEFMVVGEAVNGTEAVQKCEDLCPDVVLIEQNIPGPDGFSATERITTRLPGTTVVVMSTQGGNEYFRRAMLAGARDFLIKPFRNEELINTIKKAYEMENKKAVLQQEKVPKKGEVITVFGTKGGVGKTTVAVNLAVQLVKNKQKVALLDLDLQFGDITVFLNLFPRRTISELIQEGEISELELVESYLLPHVSGVKVLPAPSRPEYAELVTVDHVQKIINLLKKNYDYLIIDTSPFFMEPNLTALDMSTQILLILAMDLATIKNVKLSLELLASLQHLPKTKLILNRAADDMGITIADAEKTLDFLVAGRIPSEGKIVVPALNEGIPFVLSHPQAKVSKAIQELAALVIEDQGYQDDLKAQRRQGLFTRLWK